MHRDEMPPTTFEMESHFTCSPTFYACHSSEKGHALGESHRLEPLPLIILRQFSFKDRLIVNLFIFGSRYLLYQNIIYGLHLNLIKVIELGRYHSVTINVAQIILESHSKWFHSNFYVHHSMSLPHVGLH